MALRYQQMRKELKNQIVCVSAYDMCSILWLLGDQEMVVNGEYSGNISESNQQTREKIFKMCKSCGIPEEAYSDWYKDRWGCEE